MTTARWGDRWWQRAHTRHHCPAGPIHRQPATISDTNPRQTGATAMLTLIQRYWKAFVALVGSLASVAVALNLHTGFAGKLSAWIIALATALGVGIVRNKARKP